MTGHHANPPRVAIIVAMDRNRVIGKDNRLPWHISEDLKRFKALTMGHPIIMGRKTFESIGRVLPGRLNIVVTRQPHYTAPAGVQVVNSIQAGLMAAPAADEVFVIGGRELYEHALSVASRLHITHVDAAYEGDTWFPAVDLGQWEESFRQHRDADPAGTPAYDFISYERR